MVNKKSDRNQKELITFEDFLRNVVTELSEEEIQNHLHSIRKKSLDDQSLMTRFYWEQYCKHLDHVREIELLEMKYHRVFIHRLIFIVVFVLIVSILILSINI